MLATSVAGLAREFARGPIPLAQPLPDIDLIVADEGANGRHRRVEADQEDDEAS